jgi:predicted peroxiredoxin
MSRRNALMQVAALPLLMAAGASTAAEVKSPLKVMMKSAWGSDDPTKAAFPFLHGNALSEAGHTVQIFLLGEAVSLMRASVAKAVVPVGWPPLEEVLQKVVARKIPIFACGACSRARGIADSDLAQWGPSLAILPSSSASSNGRIASSRSDCASPGRARLIGS